MSRIRLRGLRGRVGRSFPWATIVTAKMMGPAKSVGVSVVDTEEKDYVKEKRSRVSEAMTTQQAGQSSGTEDRPLKTRKVVSDDADDEDKDDPMALARRALDMFRQEVEEDGDYVEPDTTPGEIEPRTISTKVVLPKGKKSPTLYDAAATLETHSSRCQKALRQPIIIISHEDDPSIL